MLSALRRSAVRPFATSASPAILFHWKKLLDGQHSEEAAIKDLLNAAISIRGGRSQDIFSDDLTSIFCSHYLSLDKARKHRLFLGLVSNFSIDYYGINAAISDWKRATEHSSLDTPAAGSLPEQGALRAAERLWQASQPLHSRLWAPLAQNAGLSFLVDLRGDLLDCIADHPAGAAPLRAMSEGLRRALAGWFSVSLLRLERITWGDTSAAILEMIAKEEKVHPILDYNALKQRLGLNRRVFAWTHPSLPGEPLVALHVALCNDIASSINAILEHGVHNESLVGNKSKAPTVAVFYSISSMKPGLAGVDLGNNLIKRAAKELMFEIPSITSLATLSPIPGFAAWLNQELGRVPVQDSSKGESILLADEHRALESALGSFTSDGRALLREALDGARWLQDTKLERAVKTPLMRLCTHYLVNEKHRGRALDPVANFHLRNGAQIGRMNWRGDCSGGGLRQSHGIMVNYYYDLDKVDERNHRYTIEGQVDASEQVLVLLRRQEEAT